MIKLVLCHTSLVLLQSPEGYVNHDLTAKAEVLARRPELANALQVLASVTLGDILLVKAGGMALQTSEIRKVFPILSEKVLHIYMTKVSRQK